MIADRTVTLLKRRAPSIDLLPLTATGARPGIGRPERSGTADADTSAHVCIRAATGPKRIADVIPAM
jgi:hypothetical protein